MTCPPTATLTELGCIPNDVGGFVGKFYGIGLGLVGGAALLGIVYGGFLLATSGGNPSLVRKGKNYILYSIIGISLVIFTYTLYYIITHDILRIPGVTQ